MFFKAKPNSIPSAEQALPGRAAEMTVAENHYVNQHSLKGPDPAGPETI